MNKLQQGFTLIELMIVLAIIGILAAVAVPAYQDYIARSQMTEAINLTNAVKPGVSQEYSATGTCPDNVQAAASGIAIGGSISGKYVAGVYAGGTGSPTGGCTITAVMKNAGLSTGIQGAVLTLSMATTPGGVVTWSCASSALQKYLPESCVGA